MITRDEALEIVKKYVKNKNLINHMLAVEAGMGFYAQKFGEDEELWRAIGVLHDFDYEIHPDMERHPSEGAKLLREMNIDEEIIQIILSHADYTGVPRDSLVRKALHACDEITGLITAVALVRPSKSIHDVKLKSVKKKWKYLQFAAGADRDEMDKAFEEFGVEKWEHIQNMITAMQGIAAELGLEGVPVE